MTTVINLRNAAARHESDLYVADHTTGTSPLTAYQTEDWNEPDPHCYVCHRHTDHFAEHDSLVMCGLASYGEDGSVLVTPFARTPIGEDVRDVYDAVITRACSTRRVTLELPERAARTYMASLGMELPPAP